MFPNQTTLPPFWLLFQLYIGGTEDRQKLALSEWTGQRRILEVGCSVGNIAGAFRRFPDICYTGVDIDKRPIATAHSKFSGMKNFHFFAESLEEHVLRNNLYDYILVAGMLHHVDTETAHAILTQTRLVSAPGAAIVIYDPDTLTKADPWYMHWYYKLEEGQFLRSHDELEKLIAGAGLHIRRKKLVPQHPGLPGLPPLARFSCFAASWEK